MSKGLKKIKELIPPIVARFIMENIGYIGMAPWQHMPKGFAYKVKSDGWNLDSIAQLQADKWPSYVERIRSSQTIGFNHESNVVDGNDPFFHNLLITFAYVLTLAAAGKKNIKFLDWGGGIGHYGLLAEELVKPTNVAIDYYNYDFDVFNTLGKKLNPHYTYFDNSEQFKELKFDLLMASSSIWYEANWKDGLDILCTYNSEYLYITRMIFITNKPSFVAIQRPKKMGYDTEYLFWIINKNEFLGYLIEKNFNLIREFEFGPVTPIFKAPEQGTMKGFLFKRNTNNEL